jgi:hypothetical protein
MPKKIKITPEATSLILSLWAADLFHSSSTNSNINKVMKAVHACQGRCYIRWSDHIRKHPLDRHYPDPADMEDVYLYSAWRLENQHLLPFTYYLGNKIPRNPEYEVEYMRKWATQRRM